MNALEMGIIVEGHGEVQCAVSLVTRVGQYLDLPQILVRTAPFKVARSSMTGDPNAVPRALQLFQSQGRQCALVLLDADDSCPLDAKEIIAEHIFQSGATIPTEIVVANKEFEAWFIAGVQSIRDQLGERTSEHPEEPRDAKGIIKRSLPSGKYSPTIDQRRLVAELDIELAKRNSRSFRRLCTALDSLARAT